MYPNREVFERSPLALVAAEIRFSDAARLRQQATLDEITLALEDRFPFAGPLQQVNINFVGTPQMQQQSGVVLRDAASTSSLTIMSSSMTYETTAYTDFDALIDSVTAGSEALINAKVRPAVQRIGLRYIDEVRVPDPVTDVRQWSKWIDHRLLDHLDVGPKDVSATVTQGLTTFDLGEGRGVNFRFAALNQGPIVVPQNLTRPAVESGPFFVLDFDGYQEFAGGKPIPLSVDVISKSLAMAHAPCGATFQRSITEEARKLFRGDTK